MNEIADPDSLTSLEKKAATMKHQHIKQELHFHDSNNPTVYNPNAEY